jgi:hypothetical protein
MTRHRIALALGASLLAACGPGAAPGAEVPAGPPTAAPVIDVGHAAASASASTPPLTTAPAAPEVAPATKLPIAAGSASAGGLHFACKLSSPRKSDDPCSADADCGVSEPCHAKACVAKAASHPPGPGTTCTRNLVCDSADANRCGCFEGRCALIPP